MQEIELKLVLDKKAEGALRRHPLLYQLQIAGGRDVRMRATYFDTPDHQLRNGGFGLRIRQEGGKRVQTLKAPKNDIGGIQVRYEWNCPFSGVLPDIDLIPDKQVREKLKNLIGNKPLIEVFSTDVMRSLWQLDYQDSEIEAALDVGKIKCDFQKVTLRELELELISGSPLSLVKFARRLGESVDLIPSIATKASTGYALQSNHKAGFVKIIQPAISSDMSPLRALSVVLGGLMHQLMGNADAIMAGDDISSVHQARVAIRRMRAVLKAFQALLGKVYPKQLRKDLSWVQSSLGAARDWDVFGEGVVQPLLDEQPVHPDMIHFAGQVRVMRARGRIAARKTLRSRRYGKMLLNLQQWLMEIDLGLVTQSAQMDVEIISYGADVLKTCRDTALGRGGGDLTKLNLHDLHKVRISLKNFRYVMDVFEAIFEHGETASHQEDMMRSCRLLQDHLGQINDCAGRQQLLDDLGKIYEPLPESIAGKVIMSLSMEQVLQGESLKYKWSCFNQLTPYW
jgi:inorganic triphosphatase YgiF